MMGPAQLWEALRDEWLVIALCTLFYLWLALLALWCDVDSRLQHVERITCATGGVPRW